MVRTTMDINQYPLPHFNERPPAVTVDTLIIHSIHSLTAPGMELDPQACITALDSHKVSAHYIIAQDGAIWQLVDESHRAWHAGLSQTPDGRQGVNDFSIGVELISLTNTPFPPPQYKSLASLTADLLTRHPLQQILGHDQIALPPGRKSDPGPHFNWQTYNNELQNQGVFIPRVG